MSGVGRRVVVTGTGAICALGDRPGAIHQALCDGRRGFGAPTIFSADVAPGVQVAEIRDFAPQAYLEGGNVRPLDRTGKLAAVGVQLALADSGWTADLRRERPLGLILGTMFCSVRTIAEFDRRAQSAGIEYASPMDFSNTVLNAAAGQVAIWHRLRGVNTTICAGAVSGVHAIGYAAQLIQTGRADALVAGGVEEVCYESFRGIHPGRLLAPPGPAAPHNPRNPGPIDDGRTRNNLW
ncbi:MAG: beta-ketoacyl synthase N-terminal-like domain-containing protein, partial [Vicinamibacterales bacterium]